MEGFFWLLSKEEVVAAIIWYFRYRFVCVGIRRDTTIQHSLCFHSWHQCFFFSIKDELLFFSLTSIHPYIWIWLFLTLNLINVGT
ncbi:hypothetical protein GDO86_012566 [Hymenochirus boettgeri]|uniref:Uncharacterized protein n=1 Tax=Hymenochirus boettgeri TaxID=247094 RepID=A0A8T2IMV2_9PIPI|nr:hypothetical protein GDO86_012566 [Hymenochirus boettgeri]